MKTSPKIRSLQAKKADLVKQARELSQLAESESRDFTDAEKAKLVAGARALGSAFQKVNFLRDLAADARKLGRSYFPNITPETLTEAEKNALVEDIRGELRISAESIPMIPKGSRRAVVAAHLLFEKLNEQIGNTPAREVISTRISVPTSRKALILFKAMIGVTPK